MQKISRDEFYDLNANHMVGVSADEREFYRLDEDTLGVVSVDHDLSSYEDNARVRATVLRHVNGRYQNDGSKFESARTEENVERSREKVEEWLQNQ